MNVKLMIDQTANSAYVRLLNKPVNASKVVNGDVIIDLDDMTLVIGIEILDLEAEIPFTELLEDFHVHSSTVELLRKLRPSISGFMSGFSSEGRAIQGTRVGVGSPR